MIIAGASAALLVSLAAATTSLVNRGKLSPGDYSAATTRTTSTVQQAKIPAAASDHPSSRVPASTKAETQNRSETARQPMQKDAGRQPQKAQSLADQLHTPTRLDVQAASLKPVPLPPEGIVATDIAGSNNSNAIRAVFGSPNKPRVQIASQASSSTRELIDKTSAQQAISVPASIALGLLIQDTRPIYPSIARSARVSGTVVLAATVSSTGKIESLRVVSGPEMLRNSAVEAVRTWRFKPYVLNNQPTPFGTVINLHFALNN